MSDLNQDLSAEDLEECSFMLFEQSIDGAFIHTGLTAKQAWQVETAERRQMFRNRLIRFRKERAHIAHCQAI